jgi:entericidin B
MKSVIAIVVSGMLALAGCNTIQGAGQDIEAGGEKVQDAAQDAKKKM